MATKIKALKCPNCGSEKHIDLGNKRFLCKSCGTEFYIDDDDITINVNHHIDFDGKSFDQSKKTMGIFAVAVTVGTTGRIYRAVIQSMWKRTTSLSSPCTMEKIFVSFTLQSDGTIFMATPCQNLKMVTITDLLIRKVVRC